MKRSRLAGNWTTEPKGFPFEPSRELWDKFDGYRTLSLPKGIVRRFRHEVDAMSKSESMVRRGRIYPTYRGPFDVIFQCAKNEEWCARGDSNSRPFGS
jgi:hypothetical protein